MTRRIGFAVAALSTLAAIGLTSPASGYPTRPATIWTVAGTGDFCLVATGACGDGPVATSALLTQPRGVALDAQGNVYISDTSNLKIRKLTPAGAISTFAGTGAICPNPTTSCGDGPNATAATLNLPAGIAVDTHGNVFVADQNDNKIRKITPGGAISTVAGDGNACPQGTDSCGDGGPATSAQLRAPTGVAVDANENIYIADQLDSRVRKVNPAGVISAAVGDGNTCADPTTSCGDGSDPAAFRVSFPFGVAVDSAGNLYIADTSANKVRKLTTGGTLSTVAGNGTGCAAPTNACGDGAAATNAQLKLPRQLALDGTGALYIVDQGDHKIREVTTSGRIGTIAGTGDTCATVPFCGDGGAGTAATLSNPGGVAVDPSGQNVLIGDTSSNLVRWLAGPQAGPPGAQGVPGANGGAGAGGGQGQDGAPGASGPGGRTGARGPAGRDAKVKCKVSKPRKGKVKVRCTVTLSARRNRMATARLTRGRVLYAKGRGRVSHGRAALRLHAVRRIKPGRYTLTTRVGAGTMRSRVTVR